MQCKKKLIQNCTLHGTPLAWAMGCH